LILDNLNYSSHEMEHCLTALQSYIYNQIIHVAWHEFQEQLDNNVKSLDHLREAHLQYINSILFK
jgi:flagellin-specific chaperone FliS